MESLSIREGIQIVSVMLSDGDIQRAVHYIDTSRLLSSGDKVLLNVTAVQLGLGSGGYHLVAAVLHDEMSAEKSQTTGHIMKLKYTPYQRSVLSVEEADSPFHELFQGDRQLDGMPVLLGELHSMLPVVMCWLRYRNLDSAGGLHIAYVMSDGGALPIDWSEHVAILEQLGWLKTTITYGQAYGGKLEAVNKFSALLAAKYAAKADLSIVTMGPGIVGTGTRYGYSGLEIGELVNAVHTLGGMPIVIPRISFGDQRERHRGVSHHTMTALKLAAKCPATVPIPVLNDEENIYIERQWLQLSDIPTHQMVPVSSVTLDKVDAALRLYPKPITSMGRGLSEDPVFFQAVCSAAEWAWLVHNQLA